MNNEHEQSHHKNCEHIFFIYCIGHWGLSHIFGWYQIGREEEWFIMYILHTTYSIGAYDYPLEKKMMARKKTVPKFYYLFYIGTEASVVSMIIFCGYFLATHVSIHRNKFQYGQNRFIAHGIVQLNGIGSMSNLGLFFWFSFRFYYPADNVGTFLIFVRWARIKNCYMFIVYSTTIYGIWNV